MESSFELHTSTLSNNQFSSYLKSQKQLSSLVFQIEQRLSSQHPFYYNSILCSLKGKSLSYCFKELTRQNDLLLKQKSFLHKVTHAFEARKKCIMVIKRSLANIGTIMNAFNPAYRKKQESQPDQLLKDYSPVDIDISIEASIKAINSIFQDMVSLRDITLYLIQTIHNWKVPIEEWTDKCGKFYQFFFIYEGRNAYEIMKEDTGFIWKSKIKDYIWIEYDYDPIMVRNINALEQREHKEILEEYFLEIFYPDSSALIDRALRCYDMLSHKHHPITPVGFEEQQTLIQNYLNLKNEDMMLRLPPESPQEMNTYRTRQQGFSNNQNTRNFKNRRQEKQALSASHAKQVIQNSRTKKNPKDSKLHAPRKNNALAILKKQNVEPQKNQLIERSQPFQQHKLNQSVQKSLKKKPGNMPETLPHVMIPTIEERNKNKTGPQYEESFAKNLKLRSFSKRQIERTRKSLQRSQSQQDCRINLQEKESRLNLKQFYQFFRADTSKPTVQNTQKPKIQKNNPNNQPKNNKIYTLQPRSISSAVLRKQNGKTKHTNSQYQKIEEHKYKLKAKQINDCIKLKAKCIPLNTLEHYLEYISSQQNTSIQAFNHCSPSVLLPKMKEPTAHYLLFELQYGKKHIGQVLLEQSIGQGGHLKYLIQFINLDKFQLLAQTIARVSQELLTSTPCMEIQCPFLVDKLNPTLMELMELMEKELLQKIKNFGEICIMEKPKLGYKHSNMFQRMYVITNCFKAKRDISLCLKMMSYYRSLKLQAKCLLLTCDFKTKSKCEYKPMQNYNAIAIGQLYVEALRSSLPKLHQKLASTFKGSIKMDKVANLIKENHFLRSVVSQLIKSSKDPQRHTAIDLTVFKNIAELQNYLSSKKDGAHFHFDFSEEPRQNLNRQMLLAEFSADISLDFPVTVAFELLILHNVKKLQIQKIDSASSSCPGYLLPTNSELFKLFVMQGKQYSQLATDKMDLFSYLTIFMQEANFTSIYINNIAFSRPPREQGKTISKCYKGFQGLFPEKQFYTICKMNCINYWDSYYTDAVVCNTEPNALILEHPLVGFYHLKMKKIICAFILPFNRKNSYDHYSANYS